MRFILKAPAHLGSQRLEPKKKGRNLNAARGSDARGSDVRKRKPCWRDTVLCRGEKNTFRIPKLLLNIEKPLNGPLPSSKMHTYVSLRLQMPADRWSKSLRLFLQWILSKQVVLRPSKAGTKGVPTAGKFITLESIESSPLNPDHKFFVDKDHPPSVR